MRIVLSILVILFLITITLLSFLLLRKSLRLFRAAKKLSLTAVGAVIMILVTLLSYGLLLEYTYPFDRTLELELIETIEIPAEHTLSGPQVLPWHAAYEKYGLWGGSLYFDTDVKTSYLGFDWPDLDYQHHNYIISYGQTVESLSYNVWDVIYAPYFRGAKVGYAVLGEQFEPNIVYIYQTKKIRIDNDE